MKITKEELDHHLTNKTQSEIDFILGKIREAEAKPRRIIRGTIDEVLDRIRQTDFATGRRK